jgi:hypothetical protein
MLVKKAPDYKKVWGVLDYPVCLSFDSVPIHAEGQHKKRVMREMAPTPSSLSLGGPQSGGEGERGGTAQGRKEGVWTVRHRGPADGPDGVPLRGIAGGLLQHCSLGLLFSLGSRRRVEAKD